MPLLYRDAPLNSIWEGSGNVAALDVLRAIVKEPEGLPAFLAECELAAGADAAPRRPPGARARAVQDAFAGGRGSRRSVSTPAVRAPGAWSRTWRWRCRPRCWSATPRPPSPTRSAPRGWTATAAASTGRCRAGVDAEAIIERALPAV